MIPVNSSNLSAYSYDEDSQTLDVQFRNGRTYRYSEVPPTVAETLKDLNENGGSVGSFFSKNVRNTYQATELQD